MWLIAHPAAPNTTRPCQAHPPPASANYPTLHTHPDIHTPTPTHLHPHPPTYTHPPTHKCTPTHLAERRLHAELGGVAGVDAAAEGLDEAVEHLVAQVAPDELLHALLVICRAVWIVLTSVGESGCI